MLKILLEYVLNISVIVSVVCVCVVETKVAQVCIGKK